MDWFEKLTGFREAGYEETRSRLAVEGNTLRSLVNGASYDIGKLELVSLHTLRERVRSATNKIQGKTKLSIVTGDVRKMHQAGENAGALFQVASQFNLLEMVAPEISPEDGVTRYQSDLTQGPACAIAAGAATIYRNYFVPCNGDFGQTRSRQLDGLADIGADLCRALSVPISTLWNMQNGYALATQNGVAAISSYIKSLSDEKLDHLRGKLRIGLHWDVEVTEGPGPDRPRVSQAFCSALPIAYCQIPPTQWGPFASLVLESAYEATILAAQLNAERGRSNVVFLTLLGGGAFGNPTNWIYGAIRRALNLTTNLDLDVRMVSYSRPTSDMIALTEEFRT